MINWDNMHKALEEQDKEAKKTQKLAEEGMKELVEKVKKFRKSSDKTKARSSP